MRGCQWKVINSKSELTHNRVNIQTKFFRRNVFQKYFAIMKAFEQVHMSRLSNLVNCFNFLLIKFYRHIGNGFFGGGGSIWTLGFCL